MAKVARDPRTSTGKSKHDTVSCY